MKKPITKVFLVIISIVIIGALFYIGFLQAQKLPSSFPDMLIRLVTGVSREFNFI